MNVRLSPDLQECVDEKVKTGEHPTAEDVVQAALANLRQQEGFRHLSAEQVEAVLPGVREKIASRHCWLGRLREDLTDEPRRFGR